MMQRLASAETSGWRLCEQCQPVLGDELAGSAFDLSCGAGIVHRADAGCRALQRQLAVGGHTLVSGARAQPLLRRYMAPCDAGGGLAGFLTAVVVFVRDRRGILLDVSMEVTCEALNIIDVHSETLTPGGEAAFQFTVQVADSAMLQRLVSKVERVEGAVKVVRGGMEELMRRESPAGFWANCALPVAEEGPPLTEPLPGGAEPPPPSPYPIAPPSPDQPM